VRRLLALVGAVVFFESAFYAVITPLLPELSIQYGLTKAQAGVLTASYGAGTLAGSLPFGWFVARSGVRPAMQLGLGLMVVASIAFPLAGTAAVLDIARFAQGVGAAGCWTAGLGWVVGSAGSGRRGTAIGTVMASATIGALTGPALGGVASAAGIELVFSVAAAFGVGCIVWAQRMPVPARVGQASLALLAATVRHRRVALGLWLMLLPGLMFGTIYVLTPLQLDDLGAGAGAIAAAFLVAAGLEAGISPLAGRLIDRRGPLLPASAGLAGGALAMALLPWPTHAWQLVLTIMLAAPLIGFLWTPSIALAGEGAEALGVEPGFAFALTNMAWALGQAAGSAGSAALAQATADTVPYLLLSAICTITLVAVRRRAPLASGAT
jgi:MFS family permease